MNRRILSLHLLSPRRLTGVALAALLVGGSLLGSSAAIAQAPDDGFGPPIPPRINGPKIHIPEPKFHWGKVLQGEKIEHTYRVQNQGSAPLRITNVKPG